MTAYMQCDNTSTLYAYGTNSIMVLHTNWVPTYDPRAPTSELGTSHQS